MTDHTRVSLADNRTQLELSKFLGVLTENKLEKPENVLARQIWKVVIMLTATPDFQFHCAPAWECYALFCLIVKKIQDIHSPTSSSVLKSNHNYQPTDPD